MAKTQTIEEAFESLETLISKLENGNTSLEEAFKLYNEGVKLVGSCNAQLDKVEKKLMVLDADEASLQIGE